MRSATIIGLVFSDAACYLPPTHPALHSVGFNLHLQTGTAEDFAGRLVKEAKGYGIKAMVADLEDYDMARLEALHEEVDNPLAVFCLATYGEGDPTDNASVFWEMLKEHGESDEPDFRLNGLNFAVFGAAFASSTALSLRGREPGAGSAAARPRLLHASDWHLPPANCIAWATQDSETKRTSSSIRWGATPTKC